VLFILFYLWVLPGLGFLAQSSPFWLFLDPVLLGEITRGSFGGFGIRYSAMRIYGVDWLRCESGLLGGEISETWGMVVAEDRALGRVFSQCV